MLALFIVLLGSSADVAKQIRTTLNAKGPGAACEVARKGIAAWSRDPELLMAFGRTCGQLPGGCRDGLAAVKRAGPLCGGAPGCPEAQRSQLARLQGLCMCSAQIR